MEVEVIGKFNWNAQCRTQEEKLKLAGLPPCRPRSTFRTYFRELKTADPGGWLEKTKQFTGESEKDIKQALAAKRTTKGTRPKPAPTPQTTPASKLPILDIIDTMTTPQEASDFVRSSPSISEQFLIFVTTKRKSTKHPKR